MKRNQTLLLVVLSDQERQLLEEVVSREAFSIEARRAQALLWLDAGESPPAIASRLKASRQTVYNWAIRFKQERSACDMTTRLADRQRPGRPRTVSLLIDPLLRTVLDQPPSRFGYSAEAWSITLLGRYLRDAHHVVVNRTSISAALRRLGRREKFFRPLNMEFEVLEGVTG
ncbi:MAG: helix-turn-helix domain-containing protein [Deltaproteobacteria bacterium]|nr:helix-turn-helix domain-containing protein [Deltaproteobacteria bacterium]